MTHSPKSLRIIFLLKMMVTRPRQETASLIQMNRFTRVESFGTGLKTMFKILECKGQKKRNHPEKLDQQDPQCYSATNPSSVC